MVFEINEAGLSRGMLVVCYRGRFVTYPDLEGFQILSLRRGHARLTIRWLFVCCYGYSQETVQPSKFRTDLAELLSTTFTDKYVV